MNIALEPLSAAAFAPFGEVIEEFEPSVGREAGRKPMKRLGFGIQGAADLYVIRYDRRPMRFTLVERHLDVTETRVPLTPEPAVLAVAESTPDGSPVLESFRAFLLNGRQGVLIAPATWHPLDCFPDAVPYVDFAFISEAKTEEELRVTTDLTQCRRSRIVDLRRDFGVECSVVDPAGWLSAPTESLEG